MYRRILRSKQKNFAQHGAEKPPSIRTVWNKGEAQKQMQLALRDITSGLMTVRRAALVYGIPKSTLHDRVSGKVNNEAQVGAPKYLTDEEEEEVVKWLEDVQKVLRTCVL